MTEGRERIRQLWRGEPWAEPTDDGPWSIALRAHRALVVNESRPELTPPDEPEPAREALRGLTLGCLIRRDLVGLERCAALAEGRDRTCTAPLWLRVLRDGAHVDTDTLEVAARHDGDPARLIEAMALRAFGASVVGDVTSAVGAARRAARVARVEGLWPATALSAWVLARVRRLQFRPHLARWLLTTTVARTGAAWSALLDWERVLVGDEAELGLAGQLRAAIDCGETERWEVLLRSLRGSAVMFDEARTCRALVSPELPVDPAGPIAAWRDGRVSHPPLGLSPVGGELSESGSRWIRVTSEGPAQRFLGTPGAALGDSSPRVRKLLAVLAFSGPGGLSESAAFERVYGFAFRSAKHAELYRMLIHRARRALGDGRIERFEGGLRLTTAGRIDLPDPEASPTVEERALAALAGERGLTARRLAERCGVSLRSLQRALRDLVEEGVLSSARKDRQVVYEVEDTAFTEPTAWRER